MAMNKTEIHEQPLPGDSAISEKLETIIAMHAGALGDFLLVWPSLLALADLAQSRKAELVWAGRDSYRVWTDPLGCAPCPAKIRQGLDELYSAQTLPQKLGDLEKALVVWFGLTRPPFAVDHPHLWFVPGICEQGFLSPRLAAKRHLQALGIAWPADWLKRFGRMFGRWSPDQCGGGVLLFAGAGHRAKQWPVVQYVELALWLQEQGLAPRFVYGPAELERGLDKEIADLSGNRFAASAPQDFTELSGLLLRARAVAGNDCGPMHLAGLLGVLGVVLFGPTSRRQWKPLGLESVTTDIPCRPCTRTTAAIPCPEPRCILEIQQQAVRDALGRAALARFRNAAVGGL